MAQVEAGTSLSCDYWWRILYNSLWLFPSVLSQCCCSGKFACAVDLLLPEYVDALGWTASKGCVLTFVPCFCYHRACPQSPVVWQALQQQYQPEMPSLVHRQLLIQQVKLLVLHCKHFLASLLDDFVISFLHYSAKNLHNSRDFESLVSDEWDLLVWSCRSLPESSPFDLDDCCLSVRILWNLGQKSTCLFISFSLPIMCWSYQRVKV